jgi:hypothetical protein
MKIATDAQSALALRLSLLAGQQKAPNQDILYIRTLARF